MYYFEGKDYSKDPSTEDQKSFDRLLEEQLDEFQKTAGEGRALRHKAGVRLSPSPQTDRNMFLNWAQTLNLFVKAFGCRVGSGWVIKSFKNMCAHYILNADHYFV